MAYLLYISKLNIRVLTTNWRHVNNVLRKIHNKVETFTISSNCRKEIQEKRFTDDHSTTIHAYLNTYE